MTQSEAETVDIAIRGPLRRSDLPGLCARVRAVLSAHPGALLRCDVSEVAADAVTVEALARLHLGARRCGSVVTFRTRPPELIELATFMGLAAVLGLSA